MTYGEANLVHLEGYLEKLKEVKAELDQQEVGRSNGSGDPTDSSDGCDEDEGCEDFDMEGHNWEMESEGEEEEEEEEVPRRSLDWDEDWYDSS